MGKTPKPLTIFVLPPLDDWEEFKALAVQGHVIHRAGYDPGQCDLVIGPTAWFMDTAHRKYLPLAIKAARARRYGKDSDDPPSASG